MSETGATVELLASNGEQARQLGRALAEARDRLTVDWTGDASEAQSRLAWPDVTCLVVVHDAAVGTADVVRSVRSSYPLLPIVAYGAGCDLDADVDATVEGDGPASINSLADAIERVLEQRARRRQAYDIDDPPTAIEYPNVSDRQVEALLDDGLDRDTLRELLHKSQLFEALMETIPVHLYVKDVNGRHLHISREYFEEDMAEFIGNADVEMDMVEEDHAWRAFEDDIYVIENGVAVEDKEEYLPALDQWNVTSKVPWRDADGDIVGLIGVTHDITARKEREQQIRRQNERLRGFSEVVSHDLRNPLQVARSALALVEEDCDSPHLDTVADAHSRINDVIDDVLSLAKYGQTVIDTEAVDLAETAVQAWTTAGNETGELVLGDDVGTVEGDPTRLQRLLENLFSNAVEHAGPDVRVTVESIARPAPNQPGSEPIHGFAVADDGPGIPKEQRESILEAGYTTDADGTGFGLAIVNDIVEAHGWELVVTDSEDGGARFEILGTTPVAD
ncbi:ATP-binding protein [Halapricum sp. CBA1109]|uniref:receiver/sensor box histidine kinase n=1 Tax=Halapricum sp. CBA1109 TaxID=2668068 RepID=UPI0018D21498|nr:ATP-binding protein [Halapricum sp. CBA1109]